MKKRRLFIFAFSLLTLALTSCDRFFSNNQTDTPPSGEVPGEETPGEDNSGEQTPEENPSEEETPNYDEDNLKSKYVQGEFLTLEGSIYETMDGVLLYRNGARVQEGIVLNDVGTFTLRLIKTGTFDLTRSITVTAASPREVALEDFTYYDLNKNGEINVTQSTGNQKILVIPVEIEGYSSNATQTNLQAIKDAFIGEASNNPFESVQSFYQKSSYGNLNFDITVADSWFDCGMTAREITNYGSSTTVDGVRNLLNLAVEWYKETYNTDATEFDVDSDGLVDTVWLVYSASNAQNSSSLSDEIFWAFTYWNFDNYDDANILSPVPYAFAWASFDFVYSGYGRNSIDAHTFIHETGHLLGLMDYYSYDYNESPGGEIDMMDYNIGDHMALSKYSLGWIEPTVVSETTQITLKPFENSGDFVLIGGDNFKNTAFDEYFTFEYITPTGLNEADYTSVYSSIAGYTDPGIRVYHVDNRAAYYSGYSSLNPTYDTSLMETNYGDNTASYAPTVNRNPVYQATIMPKNYSNSYYSTTNPLNAYYVGSSEDTLFLEGDTFTFNSTSKYTDLMASESNRLNKYYDGNNDNDALDFSVEVVSLTSEGATLNITINH